MSGPAGDSPDGPIRVVIADDHAVVRDGLRALVDAQPGLAVVGEAADGEAALAQACALAPDVLLLDLSMPGGGVEAAARVVRECPGVRVLVLTMHEERAYAARLLGAGAAGYVVKRAASAELVRAIRAVAAGATYVDPILQGPPEGPREGPGDGNLGGQRDAGAAATAALTAPETEVLRLVAGGHTNREVGAALGLGVPAVEAHKASGMRKLGLAGRVALVRFARGQGWSGAI